MCDVRTSRQDMHVGTNLAWSRHRFLTLLLKHPAQVLAGVSSLTSFLWLFCKRARGPAWPSGVHVSVRRVCSLCVLEQCDAAKTALRPEPREGERVAVVSRTRCPRAAVGEGRCVRSRAGPARLRAYIPMCDDPLCLVRRAGRDPRGLNEFVGRASERVVSTI